jgi:hypothetical protein
MTDPKIAPVGPGTKMLDRLPPHDELQAHLAEAADILSRMGDDLRAGWVCYLLEEIEAQRTHGGNPQLKADFEEWLRNVQSYLRVRLKRGRW